MLGAAERLLSTVLQGFYQSHQATAAAVAVNNLHLLRGMIGRPGAGVLQMNGQPTAQNTRETGADGDLPGFRNWDNPSHVRELAELWNVDEATIPHWAPPTHAMAKLCDRRASALKPFAERYSEEAPDEPERLHSELFRGTRSGGLGLLRDLQDLYLMAAECDICWTLVGQAAQGLRNDELYKLVRAGAAETGIQLTWLRGRMKQAAPQALVVA